MDLELAVYAGYKHMAFADAVRCLVKAALREPGVGDARSVDRQEVL